MNDLNLILDTGNFLYKAVIKSYRKSQKFRRGEKGGAASLKKFGFDPEWSGYDADMLRNFMVECFTVAAVNNYDLQERLKEVVKELTENPDIKNIQDEFVRRAQELIPQYNYTGEEPREGVLRTNLRTAMTSAYHAGLWGKVKQAGIYRYLQYKTREDERVREEHQSLADKVFNIDDPVWQTIYPPNGWNCRCYTTPLTHDEMQETGYPPEAMGANTQEIVRQAGVEKDFRRNAGMTKSIWNKWLDSRMKDIDTNVIVKRIFKDATGKEITVVKDSSVVNEVWGERKKEGDVYASKINRIRYGVDGFYVNDGKVPIPYEKIDEWRIGVLLSYRV